MKYQISKIKYQIRFDRIQKLSRKGFKFLILALIFALCILSLLSPGSAKAQTINPTVWQTGATGLRTTSNPIQKTAGLTIFVKPSPVPFISLQGGVSDAGWGNLGKPISLELGEIKNPGVTSATLGTETADWVHNQMPFTTNLGNTINVWVSRLSPAVLVQNTTSSLRLFSGNVSLYTFNPSSGLMYPKYIAYSSGEAVRIQAIPASDTTALSLPSLDNNWLLVWYGNNSRFSDTQTPLSYGGVPQADGYLADAPLLLKFQNNPQSIRQSSEGGIDLIFGTSSGNTLLMPLLGRLHLKASDTESWGTSGSLPTDILAKINFWTSGNRLCSYPTQVKEDYSYDNSTDTASITDTVSYLNVCSGGSTSSGFAVLPPMLSLVKDAQDTQGQPLVSFSQSLVDASYLTELGPLLGVDNGNSYTWSVGKMKKYTDVERILTNTGNAPTELVRELSKEVDEATLSGHFKPWIFADHIPRNNTRGDIYFLNPSDNLYTLMEVSSMVPEPQKTNLINYIKSERDAYPPETVYNLPNNGTLRAPFAIDSYSQWQQQRPDVFLKRVPLYSFYALAQYYKTTGDTIPASVMSAAKLALSSNMSEQDFASLFWFKNFSERRPALHNSNRQLAGLIGFVKLAQATGDSEEGLGRALLAKAVVGRLALTKYPRYLYSANLEALPANPGWKNNYLGGGGQVWNYNWTDSNSDIRQVAMLDQFGVLLHDNSGFWDPFATDVWVTEWIHIVTAYLFAYRDTVPQVFRILNDYVKQESIIFADTYTSLLPHWYMPFSEALLGAEHNINHPVDSYQIFMAKALLQKEPPENLRKYRGVPFVNEGDFFYMHKLAETIKAYQGWVWEDELGGVTPTPVPTACSLTGASWDVPGGASSVVEGTYVNLTVNTSGDCNGKNIEIKVFDDDGSAILNDEIATLPQVTAYGSTITTSWTTVYTPDSDDPADILGDRLPEYFFEARVVGESGFTNSDYGQELVVTQAGGGPSPTPTPTSAVTPTPNPDIVIFENGFDSGIVNNNFVGWDGTTLGGQGSITAEPTIKTDGQYSALFNAPLGSTGTPVDRAFSYKQFTFPTNDVVWAKTKFRFEGVGTSLQFGGGFLMLFAIGPGYYEHRWNVEFYSQSQEFDDPNETALPFKIVGTIGSGIPRIYGTKHLWVEPDTWYEVKMKLDYTGIHPTASYWFDGVFQETIEKTSELSAEAVRPTYLHVGIPWWDQAEREKLYIDQVGIYSEDPDGGGGGPTPTPPSGSPIPTPTVTPTTSPACLVTAASLPSTASENSTVTLTATGNSSCVGQTVNFSIKKNTTLAPDPEIATRSAVFTAGNTATTTWTTPVWANDCPLNPLGPCNPVYHFDAEVGTSSQRSNDLIVTDYTPTASTDWPQVAKDPQHTSYSDETLGTNFRVAWTYAFQPERVHPQVQAIIYRGKVFIGTQGANGQKPSVYAIDATVGQTNSGKIVWQFQADGSIVNSVAADNGKIFFGSLDGAVYGVYTDTENGHTAGQLAWKNKLSQRLGFSTAPILADNKVLIGGRDGTFYALNPNDGNKLWEYKIGAPILMTAAFNNGKVYFGGMDMNVYALNTSDGTLAWKTNQKLAGLAFKDYWPVVTQGKVLITPMQYASTNLFSIDENTGNVDTSLPQNDGNMMNGAVAPPCVDRDNLLIVPMTVPGSWQSGWGRLNLTTKQVSSISRDNYGAGNNDETFVVSCTGNLILATQVNEGGASYNGYYNLDQGTWTLVPPGRTNGQMVISTNGGGTNPSTISHGLVYHLNGHELIVRTTN